ncbi:MAG TPA: family 78 glycoside hydrolase catalytic domain [Opitutus sp.]|nr:family 78 glycoside hydrolase catalytic domain [Opitutus sp.]
MVTLADFTSRPRARVHRVAQRAHRLLAGLLLAGAAGGAAAETPPAAWAASWIAAPGAPAPDFGVQHFRKKISLAEKPAAFLVQVSGDNRYRLFVNGTSVAAGPARDDLQHWHYATIDLAPQLHAGENILAAEVWAYGAERPLGVPGVRPAFILQGATAAEAIANTDASWRVLRDPAITAVTPDREKLHTYIVVGPTDDVDGARYPWGWESVGFDDAGWKSPAEIGRGNDAATPWRLTPRPIPLPEETPQRLARVRRSEGVAATDAFLRGGAPLVVPAHTAAAILVDQGFETSAYPRLLVSGGRGSRVALTYAEALVDSHDAKGNRDEVAGRHIVGLADHFHPDGGANRLFTTLDYRTFRYVQLDVTTGDEPLTLDDFLGVFTGYPFAERARFASDDPELAQMWTVGWRTARLCAFETYMDCPYYERLQYVGDTRIQALISLTVSGDDRLMRHAIEQYDHSRLPEGITQSRYPCTDLQIIPPFSLYWIDMVHDYWMHRDDPAFVTARLPGIAAVLGWFEQHVDARTSLLRDVPYWNFVDWAIGWEWQSNDKPGGSPPRVNDEGSAIETLQYVIALDDAAELFAASGRADDAQRYRALAQRLRDATMATCWDEHRRLVANSPAKNEFSQHANILAVLAGALPPDRASDFIERVARDDAITQCTQYFRFYLVRAMNRAGRGGEYLSLLQPWRDMLKLDLTTFAEKPEPTRSDCHAWSASPLYDFLATVCGITPDSPGFKTVRIAPQPGPLHHLAATMPHPLGPITVDLDCEHDRVRGTVTLPAGLTGRFLWHDKSQPLHDGRQHVDL